MQETREAIFWSHVAFLVLLEAFGKTKEVAFCQTECGGVASEARMIKSAKCNLHYLRTWFDFGLLLLPWDILPSQRHPEPPLPWHSSKPFWSQFALLLLLGAFAKTKEAALRLMCGLLASEACLLFPGWGFFILFLALFCLLLGNTIWQTSVQLLFALLDK